MGIIETITKGEPHVCVGGDKRPVRNAKIRNQRFISHKYWLGLRIFTG